MGASVSAFLAQLRERGTELPPALSGALLLAAVRLSEEKSQAVRPDLLLVDDEGALSLLAGETPPDAYAAPELRKGAAPPRDPRVLVYAAGAMGYELYTLKSPVDEAPLQGPLAPVIRKALAPERKKRYRSLQEMAHAIEEIQARPSHDEARLILAAVAQTSGRPAMKLARIELRKAAAAEPKPVHPVFAEKWDPLEAPPEVFFQPEQAQPQAEPAAVEQLRSLIEEERKARHEEMLVLESRLEQMARLVARLAALEEKARDARSPSSLARDVRLLLDERRFAEAERALAAAPADDPVLQLRLGQALLGQSDPDGSRTARAEAAFRRAAEQDPGWAQPKALLGTVLLKQGKRHQAMVQLRGALALDPACAEARAALGGAGRRSGFVVAGLGVGVAIAAALTVARGPAILRAVQAAPSAAARADPLTERKPDPVPERKPEPVRNEKQSRPRKTAADAGRAAAEAAKGDQALRSSNAAAAQAAFEAALKLDPLLPSAHRGLGMVYALQGKDAEARSEYQKYLQLDPNATDKDQIERLLSR